MNGKASVEVNAMPPGRAGCYHECYYTEAMIDNVHSYRIWIMVVLVELLLAIGYSQYFSYQDNLVTQIFSSIICVKPIIICCCFICILDVFRTTPTSSLHTFNIW